MSQLYSANDSNFHDYLSDDGTYIIDFWSPTCVPCKTIEPGLKKLAVNYSSKVKIIKVNVDESPMISSRYYVRGLPTLLFIKNGSVMTQISGAVNPNVIESKLKEVI